MSHSEFRHGHSSPIKLYPAFLVKWQVLQTDEHEGKILNGKGNMWKVFNLPTCLLNNVNRMMTLIVSSPRFGRAWPSPHLNNTSVLQFHLKNKITYLHSHTHWIEIERWQPWAAQKIHYTRQKRVRRTKKVRNWLDWRWRAASFKDKFLPTLWTTGLPAVIFSWKSTKTTNRYLHYFAI